MIRLLAPLLISVTAGLAMIASESWADEGWVIRSFDVTYAIQEDATVLVTEDIAVDFGSLERHGIFRDLPVEYEYDADSSRLISVSGVRVDDGAIPVPFEIIGDRPNLRIKIGDPDRLVTGPQRYQIDYTLDTALNPFPDHDEFYWNVTGNEWSVPIEQASAHVLVPSPGIARISCFEGPTGSTTPCSPSSSSELEASFSATSLASSSGLTIVVGLTKGLVQVAPPVLVKPTTTESAVEESFRFTPAILVGTLVLAVAVLATLARLWWTAGRDRWFGDRFYLTDNPKEEIKPLFAQETIVVEYQPPEVSRRGRRLRPAEIGLLLDERADTLDVSATIVDLAVRKHIIIKELPKGGIFGIFKTQDYELVLNPERGERTQGDELLPYESDLKSALFDGKASVQLSELKNEFHTHLTMVKERLYEESVKTLKFFPSNPDTVRVVYRGIGLGLSVAGAAGAIFLGQEFGAALLGFPVALGGVALLALGHLMPRRTAEGRVMYRRCLGFRLYMVTAEKDRQAFAEKANLFHEYLPYAIVYGCVDKWAETFEGLVAEHSPDWYVGTRGFAPAAFANSLSDFSSGISNVMASTPGGSGGSGFSGGSSGGGGGGGGGGSW